MDPDEIKLVDGELTISVEAGKLWFEYDDDAWNSDLKLWSMDRDDVRKLIAFLTAWLSLSEPAE